MSSHFCNFTTLKNNILQLTNNPKLIQFLKTQKASRKYIFKVTLYKIRVRPCEPPYRPCVTRRRKQRAVSDSVDGIDVGHLDGGCWWGGNSSSDCCHNWREAVAGSRWVSARIDGCCWCRVATQDLDETLDIFEIFVFHTN